MSWSITRSLDSYSDTVRRFVDSYMLEELESIARESLSDGDVTVLHTPYNENNSVDNSVFEFGVYNSHHEDEEDENKGLALEGSFYAVGRLELWGIESDNPELDVISYYKEINPG